jgi:putative solute:sodium symporter small subunit
MPLVEPGADRPPAGGPAVDAATARAYWSKTSGLMWLMLIIWAVFSFGIHFFVNALNEIRFLGFPLGFYMASQGSLIVFVVMLFWFARRQNAIDAEFGVSED